MPNALPTKADEKQKMTIAITLTKSQRTQFAALAQLRGVTQGRLVSDLVVQAISRDLSAITEYQKLRDSLKC